jgi:hypothetical protein
MSALRHFGVSGLVAFVVVGCGSSAGGGPASASAGEDLAIEKAPPIVGDERAAFQFFVDKGLTGYQAAAIVGGLNHQSGLDPSSSSGAARGIARWEVGQRWDSAINDNVVWFASKSGQSPTSLELQLDFIWYELTTFPRYGLSAIQSSTDVRRATQAFTSKFGTCAQCDEVRPLSQAKSVLNRFGEAPIILDVNGTCSDTGSASNSPILQIAQTGLGFSYYWGHADWSAGAAIGSCSGSCPNCTHHGADGADCSGYVSKAWQLDGTPTSKDTHPYSTASFIGSDSHWTHISDRTRAQPGDAFVYNNGSHGHIVLYVSGDASGSVNTYQASGCKPGILAKKMTLGSAYKLIRRAGVAPVSPTTCSSGSTGVGTTSGGSSGGGSTSCTLSSGVSGTCMLTSDCASQGGTSTPGFCPGADNIQCCTGTGGGSSGSSGSGGGGGSGSNCSNSGSTSGALPTFPGCTGLFNTNPSPTGDYYVTDFGCSSNPAFTDPGDTCGSAACIQSAYDQGVCTSSQSHATCQRQVNWYAIGGASYGCGARLQVTNPNNGKSVVVMVLDNGPSCSVENKVNFWVLDMSYPAVKYLFGGEQGQADKALVNAVVVDQSTPLGPTTATPPSSQCSSGPPQINNVCTTDAQCSGSTPFCCDPNSTGTAQCSAVACPTPPPTSALPACTNAATDCGSGQSCCDNDGDGKSVCTDQACATSTPVTGQCTVATEATDCTAGQVCDPDALACVSNDGGSCTDDSQCPTGDTCVSGTCSSGQAGSTCDPTAQGCAAGLSCDPVSQQCSSGVAGGCIESGCPGDQICDTSSGVCSAQSATDCSVTGCPGTLTCDLSQSPPACVGCNEDSDCASGQTCDTSQSPGACVDASSTDCTTAGCASSQTCDTSVSPAICIDNGSSGDDSGSSGPDCTTTGCPDGQSCDTSVSPAQCIDNGADCTVGGCPPGQSCDTTQSPPACIGSGDDGGDDSGDDGGLDAADETGDDGSDEAGDDSSTLACGGCPDGAICDTTQSPPVCTGDCSTNGCPGSEMCDLTQTPPACISTAIRPPRLRRAVK